MCGLWWGRPLLLILSVKPSKKLTSQEDAINALAGMELGVTNRAVNNTGQKKEGMVGRMEVSSRKRKRMVCPSPKSPENLVKNSEVALQNTHLQRCPVLSVDKALSVMGVAGLTPQCASSNPVFSFRQAMLPQKLRITFVSTKDNYKGIDEIHLFSKSDCLFLYLPNSLEKFLPL